jgi:selenium-binding protein 1
MSSTSASGNGTGPGFASPRDAIAAPREEFLYVSCLHRGTGVEEPDFLGVVDVDPTSPTYSQLTHRTPMPTVGDELHHFGWQTCSSSHHCCGLQRQYLVVPGMRSSRVHIVDVLADPRRPQIVKVIEPEEIIRKTGYTRPHTVHCMPGGIVTLSMLGNAEGDAPGGFAVLDSTDFSVIGRWEREKGDQELMYDFWYQPRKNTLISSEWGAPNTFEKGFDLQDVSEGRYGHRLHFWDLEQRSHLQTVDLGEEGLIPLECRWLHDPDADTGFVGAALSSSMWRWFPQNGGWEVEGWPFPVPGLITDLVVSMDDRFLYFSNWLHGDVRQYDISDPAHPRLTGQVWCGGVLGPVMHGGRKLDGGPQMLQISMDGRRLYLTNSLYSSWDNQFYPGMKSWMLKINCDPNGGMALDPDFYVDFGSARGHEMRLPYGDPTTEIFS